MLNNFIYAQTKDLFLEQLNAGNILDEAIVFIEDTKEIWNHGHYFAGLSGSGIDSEIISELQTAVAALQSDKVNKGELSDYVKKNELPSLDGYLTKNVADSLYATITQFNELSGVVDNINTELTTKATKDELSTGLAGKLDNSAASGFVPTTRKVNGVALNDDITITATDPNAATKTEFNNLSTEVAGLKAVGAQKNVQSDWDAADGDAFIKNKPDLSVYLTSDNASKTYATIATVNGLQENINNVNTDLQGFKTTVANTYITPGAVDTKIAALVGSVPETLNTLDELAAALGDDPNFATTVSNLIGTKASQDALNETNTNVANLTAILDGKLDKTGGTISGGVFAPLKIVGTENRCSVGFSKDGSIFGYLTYNGGDSWAVTNEYYNNEYTLLHSGNVGEYKAGGLIGVSRGNTNANEFFNTNTSVRYNSSIGSESDNIPTSSSWQNAILEFGLHENGTTAQFFFSKDKPLYYRSNHLSDWKTIAFTDSNVASATKLATPRTIWGQSFDGTGDVSGNLNLNKAKLIWHGEESYSISCPTTATAAILQYAASDGHQFRTASGQAMLINIFGNVGIGTTSPAYKLDVNGSFNATSGSISGNTIIHAGNIGSQSVNYANSAGSANSVVWGNVTGKPTVFTANGYTDADLNTIKTNGSYYVASNATNKPGQYGEMLCMSNVDTHAQIYVPYAAGPMLFRGANDAGGWYNWRTIIDSETIGSQSVNYANSAANSNGLGGYSCDIATNNTTDTWVPVFSDNKLQHRVIPAAYNNAPSTLSVNYASTAGSTGYSSITGALQHSNNTITTTSDDTTAKWGALHNTVHFYSSLGQLNDQPSQYGILVNFNNGIEEVHQLWLTQASGSIFHRGGNASGWSGSWLTLLDSSNYASYVGNGTVTIKQNGTSKGTFTMNQSGNTTIELTDTNTDTNTWRPIYNGVDSTATDTSASANAVKTAYDKAVSAYNLANGKTSNTGTVTSVKVQGTGALGGSGTVTSSGTISITHNTLTPTARTTGNSILPGGTFATQEIAVDSYGHVSSITTKNLTLPSFLSAASYISNMSTASSVSSVPVNHNSCYCTISANGSFSLASTPAAGREIHVIVYNSSSADRTVSVPTSSPYVNFSGDTLTVPAGGYAEINVVSNGSKMFIRHSA